MGILVIRKRQLAAHLLTNEYTASNVAEVITVICHPCLSGEDVALVSTIVLHVLYFLVAAVSAAFLHTPLFSRLVLLLLVPLNAWVAIHRGESLGFAAMTMLILLTVAGKCC